MSSSVAGAAAIPATGPQMINVNQICRNGPSVTGSICETAADSLSKLMSLHQTDNRASGDSHEPREKCQPWLIKAKSRVLRGCTTYSLAIKIYSFQKNKNKIIPFFFYFWGLG